MAAEVALTESERRDITAAIVEHRASLGFGSLTIEQCEGGAHLIYLGLLAVIAVYAVQAKTGDATAAAKLAHLSWFTELVDRIVDREQREVAESKAGAVLH